MPSKLALVYGEQFLRYHFGADHPFKQVRVKLAFELMAALGLTDLPDVVVVPPPAATIADALLFHEAGYLDFVAQACAAGSGWLDEKHDTPAFAGGLEASLDILGGTLRAVNLVLEGEVDHAFNLGGGLHHAYPNRASGFCILNDVAVAIKYLKQRGFERIMYVDIDAHQGDGVMYSFYDDGGVLDIDFHGDGEHLFPGTGHLMEFGKGEGRGWKVNLPLPPHTGDRAFRHAFRELVPPLARAFRPQIILMLSGVDTHHRDPLTHLCLSSDSYVAAVDHVHRLAHELCDGRLVLFGGGGYDPAAVAIGWTRMAFAVAHAVPPATIPEDWRAEFTRITGQPAPRTLDEISPEDVAFRDMWHIVTWLKRRLGITEREA